MITRLLDLIYPALCQLCQTSLTKGQALCQTCADQLPRILEPFCQSCGEVFEGEIAGAFHCPNCRNHPHDFDFARATLFGSALAFKLVHSLKYQRHFFLARDLAVLLKESLEEDPRLKELGPHTLLIPVPLHWRRQQSRHGNQAYELARQTAKLTGLPFHDALKRLHQTPTQTKLNRKQRLSNLQGAFQIKKNALKKLPGRNIILIDDVFTTGSTAHECARILKKEGKVSKIAILTLVRG